MLIYSYNMKLDKVILSMVLFVAYITSKENRQEKLVFLNVN